MQSTCLHHAKNKREHTQSAPSGANFKRTPNHIKHRPSATLDVPIYLSPNTIVKVPSSSALLGAVRLRPLQYMDFFSCFRDLTFSSSSYSYGVLGCGLPGTT